MASKKLKEMISLTFDNNPYSDSFPDELLIAIFWEETLFQNIVQVRGAAGQSGLGFGQVQEDTLPLIRARMGKSYSKTSILGSDALGVAVAADALETFRRGFKSGSPETAYKVGFASATGALKNQVLDGRTRGQIADAVWTAGQKLYACSWTDTDEVRAALKLARPASDSQLDWVMAD